MTRIKESVLGNDVKNERRFVVVGSLLCGRVWFISLIQTTCILILHFVADFFLLLLSSTVLASFLSLPQTRSRILAFSLSRSLAQGFGSIEHRFEAE